MTPDAARLERVCAAVLACAVVLPLAFMPIVPTHDGFQHLLHGYLWNHLQDPGTGYATFLERGSPITAWGYTWIFAPLERLLPWRVAYQAAFALLALGLGLGARAAIRSIARQDTPLGLLGFTLAFSWPLYMGFFPFVSALAAGTWLLAFAVRRPNPRPFEHIAFTAGLLVVAMMHMLPAILVGGIVFILRAFDADDPSRWRNTAITAATGVPAAAIALLVWSAGAETVQSASAAAENHLLWQAWPTRLRDLGATSIGGPWWRWTVPLAAAVAGILISARSAARERAAGGVAALGLALGVVLPFHMTSWEFFSPRVLPFALVCGWAALAGFKRFKDAPTVIVCALVAATSLGWAHVHSARIAHVNARLQALDTTAPIQRDGWRLPIVFETTLEFPNTLAYGKPFANIGHLFVIEQGGMTPYLFASSPTIHQHLFLPDVARVPMPERSYFSAPRSRADEPALLQAIRTDLLAAGSRYQDVIAVSDPAIAVLLQERGFETDASTPDTQIARFRGCSLGLDISGAAPAEPLQVVWGWYPLQSPGGQTSGTASPTGQLELLPTGVPCGDVWVEVRTAQGPLPCGPTMPPRIVMRLGAEQPQRLRCQLPR